MFFDIACTVAAGEATPHAYRCMAYSLCGIPKLDEEGCPVDALLLAMGETIRKLMPLPSIISPSRWRTTSSSSSRRAVGAT
jgi:hypothetical protein